MPKTVGFYGSPVGLWEKGLSLRELGINTVVAGKDAVNQEMVDRCHAEGAKVYGDFSFFVGADTAEKHPELWPIGEDGKRLEPVEWYLGLCPTYEWYRQEKLQEISDFLKLTPVDGIYLDFIRWPCHWEVLQPKIEQSCFCDNALSLFSAATGIEIHGHTTRQKASQILRHHLDAWTNWKAEQITSFVRDVRRVVEEARPGTSIGLFAVPWKPDEYDDAIARIIGQDFPALAQYVDVFSPMVYHAMCGREVGWVGDYSAWLAERTGKPIRPIVQATNDTRTVSPEEFAQILQQALAPSTDGLIIFTLDALLNEPEKLEIVRKTVTEFSRKED